MTEDDKFRIELHRSDSFYGDPLAADRIEELLELNKELTLQLLATSGQAADALDKLAKAVEALRKIANAYDINWHAGVLSRAVLAELEGE
jgi:ABC-type glycerol-3-phosphate transport system substrate-binding protein